LPKLPFLYVVCALLATWALLRRRRILAAVGEASGSTLDLNPAPVGRKSRSPSVPAISRPRPRLAQLGLNPLSKRLAALSALVLGFNLMFFWARGLTLDWSTVWFGAVLLGVILVVWLNFYFVPGVPKERFVAEVLLVVFLTVLLTNFASPMQYAAVAVGAPYADPWLAAADARIGVYVPAVAAWTRAHPAISLLAKLTYATLLPQFLLTVIVLAALRERERLWEFAFHFHLCMIVTVAALTIWPAVCPPAYYGFTSTIDMTHLMGQIKGFHDGRMRVVRFDELDGLVSFPSFHVAGAVLVTWAFRHRRRILIPLMVLNVALIISTLITGVHYVVDVLAALPLFAVSLAAYHWWARPLLTAGESMQADDIRA
jgi:membrane-associated phospholipid phosphatase